jgi:hypothetical protein
VLAPIVPVLIGLGAALLLVGAGLALAGVGAAAFAASFAVIVATGSAGVQILMEMLAGLIQAIPPAMKAFGDGAVQFATAIGQGAPAIAAAFGNILSNLLDAVIKNVPKMGRAFLALLNTGLRVIVQAVPRIANAGLKLMLGLMGAIDKHLPTIMAKGASIVVKFLQGLGRELPDIIDAGAKLVIKFVNGVARAIENNDEEMGEAGGRLAVALIQGVVTGLKSGSDLIKDEALRAAKKAWEAAKDFFKIGSPSKLMHDTVGKKIPQGMAGGIREDAPLVAKEMANMGREALDTLQSSLSGVNDALALDPNMNPTVTPVLDLSQLTREATRMSSILATSPISVGTTYENASAISAETQANNPPPPDDEGGSGGGGNHYYKYEQHLHSPKAIDPVDAWRAGKSLFAIKKEELTK